MKEKKKRKSVRERAQTHLLKSLQYRPWIAQTGPERHGKRAKSTHLEGPRGTRALTLPLTPPHPTAWRWGNPLLSLRRHCESSNPIN